MNLLHIRVEQLLEDSSKAMIKLIFPKREIEIGKVDISPEGDISDFHQKILAVVLSGKSINITGLKLEWNMYDPSKVISVKDLEQGLTSYIKNSPLMQDADVTGTTISSAEDVDALINKLKRKHDSPYKNDEEQSFEDFLKKL